MLFHSLEFFVFFVVVGLHYFRAARWIRWPATLIGLVFPILQYHGSAASVVATVLSALCLGSVSALHHRGRGAAARKFLLATASLLFYSAWRWPFTSLLLFSTVLDYFCARAIHQADSPARRRGYLLLSLVGNLGVLSLFKYANFVLANVEALLGLTGLQVDVGPLPLILPLGISFYTFQTLSYTIDVYRGRCSPRESVLDVAVYVSFFPQLVAGPILRARQFLPQLDQLRSFDPTRAKSGMLLMLWGMAKKLLVADALAPIVEQAYVQPEAYSGAALLLATYCFAFQIYCDFSGYSDLAIGAARVLGFEVPANFQRPYFATNITFFWRRWHISLSSWLRDYLYIPLGGSRRTGPRTLVNLMITMLLGGLWHGASWTFVIWGAIHGAVLVLHKLYVGLTRRGQPQETTRPVPWLVLATWNFHVVCFAWIFFRAESLPAALTIVRRIATHASGLMVPYLFPAVLITLLLLIQAIQARTSISGWLLRRPRLSRFAIYMAVILMLAIIALKPPVDFIYFVF